MVWDSISRAPFAAVILNPSRTTPLSAGWKVVSTTTEIRVRTPRVTGPAGEKDTIRTVSIVCAATWPGVSTPNATRSGMAFGERRHLMVSSARMRRRPSLLLRSGRALIGLVTLWCLGCSSYEPILDSLLGAGGGMVCEPGMAMASSPGAVVATHNDRTLVSVSLVSAPTNDRGFDCGCGGSCHAPSLTLDAVTPRVSPIPTVEQSQPSEPASISRTPLLPPPERTA